jgi:hypothetical protein
MTAELTVDELRLRIVALLHVMGDARPCRSCGAMITWVATRHGRLAPYTAEGLNHFADCPDAQWFRRQKEG